MQKKNKKKHFSSVGGKQVSVLGRILKWPPGLLPLYNIIPLHVGGTCEYDAISCDCNIIWKRDFVDVIKVTLSQAKGR